MKIKQCISGLVKLGEFIYEFYQQDDITADKHKEFEFILTQSKIENSWFTLENLKLALLEWAKVLTQEKIEKWVNSYPEVKESKRVGFILAGNIPMVGWHDVLSVILSGHTAVIKLSSKDKKLIPFLLKLWNEYSEGAIQYELVEKLENIDAVIATGSNNTARYMEYYFKKYPSIIRRNRTSVAVLDGTESDEEIALLADDIFQYYGLGCRNVSRLFIPKDFELSKLFVNFVKYKEVINHNSYANNYEYNRAIYLMNQENFWDNNFVMMKEDESLFSPLSVINFTRYEDLNEVSKFTSDNENDIQCIVSKNPFQEDVISLGKAQQPELTDYADHVDTMAFLREI